MSTLSRLAGAVVLMLRTGREASGAQADCGSRAPVGGMSVGGTDVSAGGLGRRAGLLVPVLVAVVVGVFVGVVGGSSRAGSAFSHRGGWGSLPVAARGPVSSGLGRVEPEYRVRRVAGGLSAVSGPQRLRATFGAGGVRVGSGGAWFGLRVVAVGYGDSLRPLRSVAPSADGNRVEYSRSRLSEWYANGPLGLEQGFTLWRPQEAGSGVLRLSMLIGGDLRPSLSAGARGVSLDGRGVALAYRDLVASDARGRMLRSWLELSGGRLEIRVDVRGAAYPVRIDPLVQQAELTASDGAAGDWLGWSVGVSGDGSTVVAGAPGATVGGNSGQGAVYVFTEPGSGWASETQVAKLTASDGAADDELGWSVGVSGDGSTVVAGAPGATVGGNSGQGAVYVFTEPGSGWASETQVAKLTASDGAADDELGWSVGMSVDGSTVVAGADGATVAGNAGEGAAYVFTKPPSGWASETEQAKLTTGYYEGAAGINLGYSVGVSADGSTVVAGAPYANVSGAAGQGAAYVFTEPSTGWASGTEPAARLSAETYGIGFNLGYSVGVSGDGSTVVVGAPGATVMGNSGQGAAYVFTEGEFGWCCTAPPAELTASDGATGDELGVSVGVSGNGSTVVAGAPGATVAGNSDQGAAYVFTEPASGWASESEQAKLTAGGAANDELGVSVGASSDGSTVVASAPYATVARNTGQGAAYVFGESLAPSPSLSVAGPGSGIAGSAISATAESADLSGGSSPTGAITFKVFGPQASAPTDCSGGTTVGTAGVSGNGTYRPSAGFTPTTAGDYWWYASYGGDADNNSASSTCGAGMSETVVGAASPSVSVSAPSSGTAGSAISASAVTAGLSGGFSPSGTITFKVFGPQASGPTDCSGGTTVGTASVSGNGTYGPSAGFTPSSAGDYWWYASYGGDTNNNPASSTCGAGMSETVVAAAAASPSLSVSPAGSGSGAITSSPAGISCPGSCQHGYAQGTVVTLTATPASGSTFAGWSGAGCSGTDACQVTMSSAQSVTATFTVVAPKPSCALVPRSSHVFAPAHGKHKKRPPAGVLGLTVRCNQAAAVTLTGKITAAIKLTPPAGKSQRRTKTETFALAAIHGNPSAGRALTLTVKLPKTALAALRAGARESALFTLRAANANGTSTTTATIPRLELATESAPPLRATAASPSSRQPRP